MGVTKDYSTRVGPFTQGDGYGAVHQRTVLLTNAQIKALRATPVVLVPAPGTNKMNVFVSASLLLIAGANALTESSANLGIKFNSGSGVAVSGTIESTGFIDQTVNTLTSANRAADAIVASSAAANKTLVLHNLGAGEIGGNAAADAKLQVTILYQIIPTV